MATLVFGTEDWASGFRPSPTSQRHADSARRRAHFARQTDFFLDEAVIAEEQGDNDKAAEWLNLALGFEAKDRRKPAA